MPEAQIKNSETAKYRHLTVQYCTGCGLDIGSQGDPVVPWAFQLELPVDRYNWYNSNHPPHGPVQLRGSAETLNIDSDSLDFVYSSHLLEDFADWTPILTEWVRVLKPGGHLIILVPDKKLWAEALAKGQTPNCEHRHESRAGELSEYAEKLGVFVMQDRLTECFPGDYTVLFVAIKNTPS